MTLGAALGHSSLSFCAQLVGLVRFQQRDEQCSQVTCKPLAVFGSTPRGQSHIPFDAGSAGPAAPARAAASSPLHLNTPNIWCTYFKILIFNRSCMCKLSEHRACLLTKATNTSIRLSRKKAVRCIEKDFFFPLRTVVLINIQSS